VKEEDEDEEDEDEEDEDEEDEEGEGEGEWREELRRRLKEVVRGMTEAEEAGVGVCVREASDVEEDEGVFGFVVPEAVDAFSPLRFTTTTAFFSAASFRWLSHNLAQLT
jgi:hypothetical protein